MKGFEGEGWDIVGSWILCSVWCAGLILLGMRMMARGGGIDGVDVDMLGFWMDGEEFEVVKCGGGRSERCASHMDTTAVHVLLRR